MGGEGRRPLTPEQFILRFIETFRDPERSRGVHSVFSGFNAAFREYFPGLDPVEVTTQLAEAGKLEVRLVKRGAMLYKAGEAPSLPNPRSLLKKMGLE